MTAGVYAIINTATGRVYIGSSIDIERRWISHRSAFSGPEYEWSVLEATTADDDTLEQAEQHWMDQFRERLCNSRKTARRPRASSLYLDLDGLRLQSRREALGLTVIQLAWAINVSGGTLLRWEKGGGMRIKMAKHVEQTLRRLERRRATRSGDAP